HLLRQIETRTPSAIGRPLPQRSTAAIGFWRQNSIAAKRLQANHRTAARGSNERKGLCQLAVGLQIGRAVAAKQKARQPQKDGGWSGGHFCAPCPSDGGGWRARAQSAWARPVPLLPKEQIRPISPEPGGLPSVRQELKR